ncbi:unnamed protein product [Trichobilharzia szidati]|nr:unnamed protein product [Trichobilharzia szidati]
MTGTLTRYNVSVDDGFVRESTTFRELSSNAKCILANILSITNGDLGKTASFLDKLLNETQEKIRSLTDNDMSDEEFYTRLTNLKNEHRDTLDIIEQLYLSSGKFTEDLQKGDNISEEVASNEENQSPLESPKDICRTNNLVQREDYYEHDRSHMFLPQANKCHSFKPEVNCCEVIRTGTSENRTNVGDDDNNDVENDCNTSCSSWRHHITIPEPFAMTKREEALKQSKNAQYENEMSTSSVVQKDSDKECNNQFKAKPVPSHVYLPLYEKIMEKNALRREAVKAYSKEILKATEKPFTFTIRENLKREQNDFSRDKDKWLHRKQTPSQFKNDKSIDPLKLPSQLYENRFERMQEDSLLNEVKRQLRAQRLLQSASLPPGMEERQHLMNMRKLERKARDKRLNRISVLDLDNAETGKKQYQYYHPAPDFKQLHWKSSKALRRLWKPPPEPTRPKSFKLRTSERASSADRQMLQSQKIEKKENENRTRSATRQIVTHDVIEPALARSTFLRENYIRNSLAKADLDAKKKEETEHLKRLKLKEVSNTMKETLGGQIISPKKIIDSITEERKRQLIQQDLARQAEYKRELNAINERVASKPLLITRQNKIIARKRAEAKFDSCVRDAGLDPNEVLEKSSECKHQDTITNKKGNLTKDIVEPYDPENHFGDLGNN